MRTRITQRSLLIATCVLAATTAVSAVTDLPQAVRIGCGTLTVFVLPGFALASAARPAPALEPVERLLASVGLSLAMSTAMGALLAALPIGLTRSSFGVLLGVLTIALSFVALARLRSIDVRDEAEARGTS